MTFDEQERRRQWVERHLGAAAEAPFSFRYRDRPSADLLPSWNLEVGTEELDAHRVRRTLGYADPATGLRVRCAAIEYRDFPTAEWTLSFENAGSSDTPILADIQALDLGLQRGDQGEFALHHHTGDYCTPDSYEPHLLELGPGADQAFAPVGGRPCNKAFPYFDLEWPGGGLLAAIGWPGQWAARFVRDQDRGLQLRAGQELTCFRLLPGEQVRSPLIVLQFWEGDRVAAHNTWRRWMLAHNLPRTGDGRLPPPILSSCSGGFFPGLKCNEADEIRFIDTFVEKGTGLGYWWMDAGWYPCGEQWTNTGTWEPDPARFPRGLRAVTDHAHLRGLKTIVWFEPERVAPGTWLYENHPEWLLGPAGEQKLLNLGDPRARQWLVDHVDRLLVEQGIDLYRQDFNMDPLPYWRAGDAPDRQGIAEIRHVEGYLAYWDELRLRRPGLLIDSCASGGRRNDLETLRRAVPLLRSDYQSFQGDVGYAPGNQCHTWALSAWLPYYGQGVYYHEGHLEYNVRSHFCPGFGVAVDVRQPGIEWDRIRCLLDQWRQVAACYLGDYYPLTPYSLADDVWLAWQFDLREEGRGAVQAFRRTANGEESMCLPLRGLDPGARYAVTDLDTGARQEEEGATLMGPGLSVRLPHRPGTALLSYARCDRRGAR
jgi:alpha-galactosidase